jgi:hypothetical protein
MRVYASVFDMEYERRAMKENDYRLYYNTCQSDDIFGFQDHSYIVVSMYFLGTPNKTHDRHSQSTLNTTLSFL